MQKKSESFKVLAVRLYIYIYDGNVSDISLNIWFSFDPVNTHIVNT